MKDGVSGHAEALAWTSEAAWGDTDEEVFQFDEGVDLEGPLSVAAYARIDPPTKKETEGTEETEEAEERPEGRVIVVGDADFASNGYQHLSGNADLFANFVNWLAEQESLIGIAPNKAKASMLEMSRSEVALLWYAVVLGLPGASLLGGGAVWWRRRNL
jgi:ABC-type uncharacterized transport system involved in gliding motility auxiliary subunit